MDWKAAQSWSANQRRAVKPIQMKRPTARTHCRSRQRGYVLIIMLVVLIMGVLFTVVGQLSSSSAKWGRAQNTANVLAQAKEALIGHAITYRETHPDEVTGELEWVHGYLPCPDMDGDGDADTCGSAGATVAGLLPYKTLELTDLRDKSGACLWYVVSGSYKNNPKTAPMNWDTRGQIEVKNDSAGTTVFVTPADANGGAAAAIIAANAPLSGQSRSATGQTCGALPSEVAAYLDGGYSLPNSGTLALIQGKTDSAENNDEILWITPKEIWSRIDKRKDWGGDSPKKYSDINSLTAALKTKLESDIVADLSGASNSSPAPSTVPLSAATHTTLYAGQVGELPDVSASLSANLQNYFSNWKEQYRYVVCSNLCDYCLTVGGQQCNAAVFFGGATASGAPRAAGARSITDLFDVGDGQPLLLGTSATFGGASTYAGDSADVGVCVASMNDTLKYIDTCSNKVATSGFTDDAMPLGSGSFSPPNPDGEREYSGASTNTAACVWTGNSYALGSGLRVYFKIDIDVVGTEGGGAMFAVIDAAQNPPGTTPCGDSSYLLGYAGNSSDNPIQPPKIGLEFDLRGSSPGRNDPSYPHMALVYWGGGTYDDDNRHSTASDAGFPPNRPHTDTPYGVSGNLTTLLGGGVFHVRMDISRTNCNASTCDYTIDVWTLPDTGASATDITALSNVSAAYGGGLTRTVRDAFTMNRTYSGQEVLQNVRLGFTVGQAGITDELNIAIDDLLAEVSP